MNRYTDFLLNYGLYDRCDITQETENDWYALLRGEAKLDCYCTECKTQRVFSLAPPKSEQYDEHGNQRPLADVVINQKQKYYIIHAHQHFGEHVDELPWLWRTKDLQHQTRIITLSFSCAMDESHKLDFFLHTEDDYVEKVGQKPSVADLSLGELKQFNKVADDVSRKEFRRAVGLNAQGIGVGAFVYLRRIFERIIKKTAEEANETEHVIDDSFTRLNMQEKIKTLKDYLPEIISNNTIFYSIVSKGIHELSEKECLQYFPVLKNAIVLIWSEWQKKRDEVNAKKSLQVELSKISSSIGNE